jgi:hypothetical protein
MQTPPTHLQPPPPPPHPPPPPPRSPTPCTPCTRPSSSPTCAWPSCASTTASTPSRVGGWGVGEGLDCVIGCRAGGARPAAQLRICNSFNPFVGECLKQGGARDESAGGERERGHPRALRTAPRESQSRPGLPCPPPPGLMDAAHILKSRRTPDVTEAAIIAALGVRRPGGPPAPLSRRRCPLAPAPQLFWGPPAAAAPPAPRGRAPAAPHATPPAATRSLLPSSAPSRSLTRRRRGGRRCTISTCCRQSEGGGCELGALGSTASGAICLRVWG